MVKDWGACDNVSPLCLRGDSMKKSLISIFLVFAVFLTSCSSLPRKVNTDPEFVFGTDAWHGYCVRNNYIMTESEESYYYISKDCYVHVIDKKTMADTILCSKPNCLHDRRMITTNDQAMECNAYVEGPGVTQSIFYYEGELYTLGNQRLAENTTMEVIPTIMRLSLDGGSRKNIWEMKYQTENSVMVPMQYFLHRGIFYFIAEPEKDGNPYYLFGYDIHTKKVKEIYRDDSPFGEMKVIGNSLYMRQYREGKEYYLRYNLATGETVAFENGAAALPYNGSVLLYLYQNLDGNLTHKFVTVPHDSTTSQDYDITFEVPNGFKYLQTDENYLFVTELFGLGNYTMEVYDIATRQKIAGAPIPDELCNRQNQYYLMCTMDGRLFLYSNKEGEYLFFYGNIADIGTDNFQWHEVQRVN